MYADGNLYVYWESGDMSLVEATTEEFREKGRFTPPSAPEHARRGEVPWAYPAVADGRLYLRDLGTVWCYDTGAR